ncbi:MAG TPA: ATPase, partial [Deltaproteobacteria bacterium]|nr:ATPase [Deltaproteobacteria bacterium]
TTAALIAGGAILFGVLENDSILGGISFKERVFVSLFQSITCRTAGFNTVDISALRAGTLAFMIFLMFFGASPGSCGGGVKTTTLALLGAFAWSRIKRNNRVNIFKNSIPTETVAKSTSLILMSLGFIALIFFLLLVSLPGGGAQHHGDFLFYLFETVSAFGTVGLSMGATTTLTGLGKFWIILMMLIGRVGVLTFSYIITGTAPTKGIEYADENLMIG